MSARPWFCFYPSDWLASTTIALMTPEQEGGFIRLLAHAWNAEDCGLPDDDAALATLSRLGERWLNGGCGDVLRRCFIPHPEHPGRLANRRLLVERERCDSWREKSRIGGLKSAEARAAAKRKGGSEVVALVVDDCLEPKANTSPSPSPSLIGESAEAFAPSICAEATRTPSAPASLSGGRALTEFFPELLNLIATEHPAVKRRIPRKNSRHWMRWEHELGQIVRLDEIPEAELIACLRWVFEGEHKDAIFWRQQVQGLLGLRAVKPGNTLSKIEQIHDRWKRANAAAEATNPELAIMDRPGPGEDEAREIMKAAGCLDDDPDHDDDEGSDGR